MIISGALSVVAGTTFVVQSFAPGASVVTVAAYALLGGVFFLVSALRLGRTAGNDRHVAVLGGARVGRVVAQRQPQERAFDHAHPARRDR